MYKAALANFDNTDVGDIVRRHGIAYRVARKTAVGFGGYLELRVIKRTKGDFHRDMELWTANDFNNRRFRKAKGEDFDD